MYSRSCESCKLWVWNSYGKNQYFLPLDSLFPQMEEYWLWYLLTWLNFREGRNLSTRKKTVVSSWGRLKPSPHAMIVEVGTVTDRPYSHPSKLRWPNGSLTAQTTCTWTSNVGSNWPDFLSLTLMYCQMALTITGLVCVWIPKRRARRGTSLYWGGWKKKK